MKNLDKRIKTHQSLVLGLSEKTPLQNSCPWEKEEEKKTNPYSFYS